MDGGETVAMLRRPLYKGIMSKEFEAMLRRRFLFEGEKYKERLCAVRKNEEFRDIAAACK